MEMSVWIFDYSMENQYFQWLSKAFELLVDLITFKGLRTRGAAKDQVGF